MIISVSRRTDIPRYYWDWFLGELKRGETELINPFNTHQRRMISLLPNDVGGFVFWTRDPSRIAESAGLLSDRGYQFYVMVSITGYPSVLEPHAPDLEKVVTGLLRLRDHIGAERIFWRYDPIVLSSLTPLADHERRFRYLAEQLHTLVSRCIISFYDPYKKSEKRLQGLDGFILLKNQDRVLEAEQLVNIIAGIAHQYKIPLYSCAEPDWLSSYGIQAHACIDGSMFGIRSEKDPHQRPFCSCDRSVDIGTYGTCQARCVYCYAW